MTVSFAILIDGGFAKRRLIGALHRLQADGHRPAARASLPPLRHPPHLPPHPPSPHRPRADGHRPAARASLRPLRHAPDLAPDRPSGHGLHTLARRARCSTTASTVPLSSPSTTLP